MATQGAPKWSKGCPKGPKGTPKSAQGEEKEVERHPKENNKSQTYIHIHKIYANSRSTAIQRPARISPLPGPGLGCYQDAGQKLGPDVMPRGQKTRMLTRLTRMPGKKNL